MECPPPDCKRAKLAAGVVLIQGAHAPPRAVSDARVADMGEWVQRPPLAPFDHLRQSATGRDKLPYLQALARVLCLPSLRQVATRFDHLRLKSARAYLYNRRQRPPRRQSFHHSAGTGRQNRRLFLGHQFHPSKPAGQLRLSRDLFPKPGRSTPDEPRLFPKKSSPLRSITQESSEQESSELIRQHIF